jgi:uncharacterized integral membrane protein
MPVQERHAGDLARSGDGQLGNRDEPPAHPPGSAGRSRLATVAYFVAGVLVAVVVVPSVIQNTQSVHLEWLSLDAEWPLWALIGVSFLAGLLVGPLLVSSLRHARNRRHSAASR